MGPSRHNHRKMNQMLAAPSKPHRKMRSEFIPASDPNSEGDWGAYPAKSNGLCRADKADLKTCFKPFLLDQALDLLVSATCMRYRTSSADLSTLWSARGLTCLRSGNLHLQVGFTLRCLQRLSRPHFASQPCHWRDNWCTRGVSIPVLSY